jgi:hypothetical protein
MREIKFRYVYKKEDGGIIFEYFDITDFDDYDINPEFYYPDCTLVGRLQFTGLHDKNGKEIYFDDFVKAPSGNIFQVIWYDEEMRIALKHKDTIYNFDVGLYEVISNIYENPELFKR